MVHLTYQNTSHSPLEILFGQVGGDVDSRLILTWLIDFNLSTRTAPEAGAAVLVIAANLMHLSDCAHMQQQQQRQAGIYRLTAGQPPTQQTFHIKTLPIHR